MNKKFLKGLAALFAVAVLGISCSNNNPNTPQEKSDFPGLTISGQDGKTHTNPIKGKVLDEDKAVSVTVPFEPNSSLSGFEPSSIAVTTIEKSTSDTASEAYTTLKGEDFTVNFGDGSADIILAASKAKAFYASITSGDNITLKLTVTIKSSKYKDGTVVVYVNYKKTTALTIVAPSNSGKTDTNITITEASDSFENKETADITFTGGDANTVITADGTFANNVKLVSVKGLGTSGVAGGVNKDLSKLTDLAEHFELVKSTAGKLKLKAKASLNGVLIGGDKPMGANPGTSDKGEIEVKIRFIDPAGNKADIEHTIYVILAGAA